MNYKITYYDEFINDFGGVEKGYFQVIVSKDTYEKYKNEPTIINIETTDEPIKVHPIKVYDI